MYKLRTLLKQSGTNAAGEIEQQVSLFAHRPFHLTSEHPEGKHVEQQMCEAAVKEHVGKQLIHLKVGSHEKMEPEQGVRTLAHEHRHEIAHHVDDEQISCYCRYVSHLFFVFLLSKQRGFVPFNIS